DPAGPPQSRRPHAEVLLAHAVDAVTMAGHQRLDLVARHVLPERDPRSMLRRFSLQLVEAGSAVTIRRAHDSERYVAVRFPPRRQDLHRPLVFLFGRDASDRNETRRA